MTTPTRRTSKPGCITARRQISPEKLPAQYSTVRSLSIFPRLFVSILILGIALILFFRCMSILLDPDNRARGGGKWPLVVHTVTIFLIDTAYTIINLLILSVSYVDKREIQGSSLDSPGPFGYLHLTYSRPSGLVSTTAFLLNNLLVDGFLVRPVFNSLARISDEGFASSSTVATSCTTRPPG